MSTKITNLDVLWCAYAFFLLNERNDVQYLCILLVKSVYYHWQINNIRIRRQTDGSFGNVCTCILRYYQRISGLIDGSMQHFHKSPYVYLILVERVAAFMNIIELVLIIYMDSMLRSSQKLFWTVNLKYKNKMLSEMVSLPFYEYWYSRTLNYATIENIMSIGTPVRWTVRLLKILWVLVLLYIEMCECWKYYEYLYSCTLKCGTVESIMSISTPVRWNVGLLKIYVLGISFKFVTFVWI